VICKWCGSSFEGRKKSTCSKSCAAAWRWYGVSKSELPPEVERTCHHCEKILVRNVGEPTQAWHKRQYCDKSCAAVKRRRPPTVTVIPCYNHGCISYVPGSDEFKRVAALYA
jgi:hypothetical protein